LGRQTTCTPIKIGVFSEENKMTLRTILLIIVALLLIGAIPTWPYSATWGYTPSGLLALVLAVLLILWFFRKI
jgi:hypothetical protein